MNALIKVLQIVRDGRYAELSLRELLHMDVSAYLTLHALTYAPNHQLRMGNLAHQVGLTRSAQTRVTDKLMDAGYVVRSNPTGDARVIVATLTPDGHERYRIETEAVSAAREDGPT